MCARAPVWVTQIFGHSKAAFILHYCRQQSASYDARKLYGDLTAGDKTHHDVQLAFVEYFTKHRRSFSEIFLGGSGTPICNAPCYIFQVSDFKVRSSYVGIMDKYISCHELV